MLIITVRWTELRRACMSGSVQGEENKKVLDDSRLQAEVEGARGVLITPDVEVPVAHLYFSPPRIRVSLSTTRLLDTKTQRQKSMSPQRMQTSLQTR